MTTTIKTHEQAQANLLSLLGEYAKRGSFQAATSILSALQQLHYAKLYDEDEASRALLNEVRKVKS